MFGDNPAPQDLLDGVRLCGGRTETGGPALTYCRTRCMVFHMKTTLNIDDKIMKRLKEESVRQGRTMSELLETALRAMFQSRKSRKVLPPMPTFAGGVPRVNVANREALEDFMEGR